MRPRAFARELALMLCLVPVLAACGSGVASSAGGPAVSNAWARPAPAHGQSAAYLTITNSSGTLDALVAATSPAAAMVGVHETSVDASGMSGMHSVLRCEIPARGSVQLEPGSTHLMLMGLSHDLTVGATVELDVVFEHAGTVVVKAEVRQG